MRIRILILVLSFALFCNGLPVTKQKQEEKPPEPSLENSSKVKEILEYEKYLNEVIHVLESDPDFKKKLDKAAEADIRSGKIAQELEYVSHNLRTKLDEIKRLEIERLRRLASKQYELSNDIDREHLKIPQHLDHENVHTFEIDDLRKLILKTSEDIAEVERQRREEFKNYEMQKEFENQQKMKGMDEKQRKEFEKELEEKKKKHSQHEKVHHPGSKAQLEEVWEKQDEMNRNDFDPKLFFKLHDLDDNGFWDETEVKTLFIKELDKVYQAGSPEDDMRERAEEMENMREHVFKETDINRDNLISFDEFLNQTRTKEFNSDPEWETIDNSTPFSQNDYKQFEMQREEEIRKLIEQGKLPPQPDGYYNYDVVQPGYIQQNGQYIPPQNMPNQHPSMQHQQYNQGHYPQQQVPLQQYQNPQGNVQYQQQIPQYYPQQVPVEHVPHQQVHVAQQYQPQQVPQQQQHQQVPQQQQQQQVPQQQQQVPQQPQQYMPQQPQQAVQGNKINQQQVNSQQQQPQQQQQQQQQQQLNNIQPSGTQAPLSGQPGVPARNDIPQINTNHV